MLTARLADIDAAIARLEARAIAAEDEACVAEALALAGALLAALLAALDRAGAAEDDLLARFRALARGEPSWNAIRDSLRELVFYANCFALGREDALPPHAGRMAARLVRHVYLYARSRCEQAGLLEAA